MAREKGFTLVELIIVITVIAILVVIALPRLRAMIDEGDTAKAAAELRALQTAMESYYIHHGSAYPATGGTWESALTGATPTLIKTALLDPFSATSPPAQYQYSKTIDGKYYAIWSVGQDNVSDVTFNTTTGIITTAGDDIYVSNGASGVGGF